jgi:hypothetical protein
MGTEWPMPRSNTFDPSGTASERIFRVEIVVVSLSVITSFQNGLADLAGNKRVQPGIRWGCPEQKYPVKSLSVM